MTLDAALTRLTLARTLYRAACDGAVLVWPARDGLPSLTALLAPLPDGHWRREALRLRVRDLERRVAAEKVRAAIRYANGTGRRATG